MKTTKAMKNLKASSDRETHKSPKTPSLDELTKRAAENKRALKNFPKEEQLKLVSCKVRIETNKILTSVMNRYLEMASAKPTRQVTAKSKTSTEIVQTSKRKSSLKSSARVRIATPKPRRDEPDRLDKEKPKILPKTYEGGHWWPRSKNKAPLPSNTLKKFREKLEDMDPELAVMQQTGFTKHEPAKGLPVPVISKLEKLKRDTRAITEIINGKQL